MNKAFEDWWKSVTTICDESYKTRAEWIWNAAIEHIRTTEPMPVNERILATLLRIESKMPKCDSDYPVARIRFAQALGWNAITKEGDKWFGFEPGTGAVKEIPA